MRKFYLVFLLVLTFAAGVLFAKISNAPPQPNFDSPSLKTAAVLSETTPIKAAATAVVSCSAETNFAEVKRVIDGDTIELVGGEKVRYIGMDTPEIVDPRKPVQCFGKEAAAKNKEIVEGKTVRLEKDISERDKYGRLLRYVWVASSAEALPGLRGQNDSFGGVGAKAEDTFVNLELVKTGYARTWTYPPDIKYSAEFVVAEKQAREANLGLWSSCAH